MKLEDFNNLLEQEIIPKCREIMNHKGLSYSGLDDKLGNFKRVGQAAGVPTLVAWQVYFLKHVDAINAYCRGEYSDNEDILGRVLDIINYGFLAYAIITEDPTGTVPDVANTSTAKIIDDEELD